MTHDEIAIEKSIPKLLIKHDIIGIYTRYKCPCCESKYFIVHHTNYPAYCDKCGQKLDWTDFKLIERGENNVPT